MSETSANTTLRVATVQFRSVAGIDGNLSRMREHLASLAEQGVHVAAFPECAVTSYDADAVLAATDEELRSAEEAISAMCRDLAIAAVVGMPYYEGGRIYNGALVWNAEGELVERYAKVQLAEDWPTPGERLSLFLLNDVVCTVIVCHDSRYPELVRLPVIAGARLVFYVSCESGMEAESKIEPYRAQVQARAVENSVYLVQSNAPANSARPDGGGRPVLHGGGSHGQSRIVRPDGNIICEATFFGEDVLVADLDMSKATGGLAKNSMRSDLMRAWWQEGLKLVPQARG